MINPIGGNSNISTAYNPKEAVKAKSTPAKDNTGVLLEIGSKPEKEAAYKKPVTAGSGTDEIDRLRKEADKATSALRQLVEKLISRQGKNAEKVFAGEETLEIDPEAREEAQQLISEDGDLGVKKTAGRIVDFAKSLSGGDKSKIAQLRDAIKQGFDEAAKALGGELPDISKQTYDEVMKQLDQWEKGGTSEQEQA